MQQQTRRSTAIDQNFQRPWFWLFWVIFWDPGSDPLVGARSHPNFNTMCAWWWYTSLCRKQTHSVKSFACKSLQVNSHHRQSVTSPNIRGSTALAPQKLGEQPLTLLPLFRRSWLVSILLVYTKNGGVKYVRTSTWRGECVIHNSVINRQIRRAPLCCALSQCSNCSLHGDVLCPSVDNVNCVFN